MKSAEPEPRAEPTLKGDAARQTLAEDEFGLGNMVAALADTLTKRITADGYVLGIEGRWGSGKSTFANFVAEKLKLTPEHYVVRFEPWLLGEKNTLLSFFFRQFASKIDGLRALLGKSHDRPGHLVDLLMERLATTPPESFSELEAHGMAFAFADTMDEIAIKTDEFRSLGNSEIWRKATRLLRLDVSSNFQKIVTGGKSINWLANVVRDQGFAHGLPIGFIPTISG
jgi:hypothetical protein